MIRVRRNFFIILSGQFNLEKFSNFLEHFTGERLILVQAWAKTKLGHQLLDQKVQIKLGPNRSRSTYSPRQFWAMPGKIFFGPTIVQKFSNQKSPTFLRPNLVQIFLVQIWSKFFLGQIWSKFFLGQIWSKFCWISRTLLNCNEKTGEKFTYSLLKLCI